jgi:pilus assembly protein CpaE
VNGSLSVAIVLADRVLREEAFSCIGNLPVRVVIDQRTLEDVEDLLDKIERSRADVLLIEGSLLKVPLDEFARRLKLTASEPVIFVLEVTAVPDKILDAMRAGALEYLCPPLVKTLREGMERLSHLRASQVSSQQKKLGRVFGFLSAKGGSGATTFAAHISTMAAAKAQRPVLLADMDFEAGLLRFILKAKPRYTLRDAVDNMNRMDSNFWNALVWRQGKLEFIAAPEELTERSLPDVRQVARLIRFIRLTYPIAIVDFGRCYSVAAIESIAELEALYLVTTQDLFALENARDFIQTLSERARGTECVRVLLNKVPAKQKPDLDGLEKFLGVRPVGLYSSDSEALYETWSEGRLLGVDSVFGKQLNSLAQLTIADASHDQGSKEKGKGEKGKESAAPGFGKLFSFLRSSRA